MNMQEMPMVQLSRLKRPLLWIVGSTFVLFFLIGFLSLVNLPLTIYDLVGDTTAIAGVPFYEGAISNLGVLIWCGSVSVCWLTYFAIKKFNPLETSSLRFLFHSGIMLTVLMLDDLYLFHDSIAPDYLSIDEHIVLAAYVVAGVLLVVMNRNELSRSEYMLLIVALFFLGMSVAIDVIPMRLYEQYYYPEKFEALIEDGNKFAGIVSMLVFYSRYSMQKIGDLIAK